MEGEVIPCKIIIFIIFIIIIIIIIIIYFHFVTTFVAPS